MRQQWQEIGAVIGDVRLDTCDYSVHPCAIGHRVEVAADLDMVRIRRGGVLVGEHARCWARQQTIT
jgi:Mu transposase, C-terminal domain